MKFIHIFSTKMSLLYNVAEAEANEVDEAQANEVDSTENPERVKLNFLSFLYIFNWHSITEYS